MGVRLSYLVGDLTGEEIQKVTLLCDNQGAVKLVQNAEFHPRTKHIQLRWHWLREQAADGKVEVVFVGTEDQLADIFTKPLSGPKFASLRDRIGVGKLHRTNTMSLRESVRERKGSKPHCVNLAPEQQ